MIKVDSTLEYLKKAKGPVEFEKIFKDIKDTLPTLHEEEAQIKAELWNALLGSIEIVRVERSKFDLASNYSKSDIKRLETIDKGIEG